MPMAIEGLPDGVECVRIGRAMADEFELYGKRIIQGGRSDSISHVIVRPAQGWSFLFDEESDCWYSAKVIDPPLEIVIAERFLVTNSRDQKFLETAAAAMRSWPGHQR